ILDRDLGSARAVGEEALQAEDRLVKMEQRSVGVGAVIEQGEPRLGDMIRGLRAELRQRDGGHYPVMRHCRFRFACHGSPLAYDASIGAPNRRPKSSTLEPIGLSLS